MPTAFGSIGRQRTDATRTYALSAGPRSSAIGIGPTKSPGLRFPATTKTGTTSLNSVRVGGHKVYVYDRDTGKLVGMAISNANGDFTVKGLPYNTLKYHFVLHQQSGDPGSYNSARYDQVTQA